MGRGVVIARRCVSSFCVCVGSERVCRSERTVEGRISDLFPLQINCPDNLMVDVECLKGNLCVSLSLQKLSSQRTVSSGILQNQLLFLSSATPPQPPPGSIPSF